MHPFQRIRPKGIGKKETQTTTIAQCLTYPGLGASGLELRNLLATLSPCLLVILDRIDDIIPVQAVEEEVPADVALFARGAVRCDAAAVGGLGGLRSARPW